MKFAWHVQHDAFSAPWYNGPVSRALSDVGRRLARTTLPIAKAPVRPGGTLSRQLGCSLFAPFLTQMNNLDGSEIFEQGFTFEGQRGYSVWERVSLNDEDKENERLMQKRLPLSQTPSRCKELMVDPSPCPHVCS